VTVRCGTKCHKALCDCKQWIERLDHLSYVIVTYCRMLQNYLHFYIDYMLYLQVWSINKTLEKTEGGIMNGKSCATSNTGYTRYM
jgi:hypothetical protein